MDETLPKRSLDDINQEYAKCIKLIGEKEFVVKVHKAEIELLCARLIQLKQEQDSLQLNPRVGEERHQDQS